VDCQRGATDENLTLQEAKPRFVMCSSCSQCFCAALASNEDGPMGHARLHAKSACHPVALWIDQPIAAYCFLCDHSLSLKPIPLAARSHKHGCVVRGMPNCRDKCYVNAMVQCLLALDDLWMSMLGPHAMKGPCCHQLPKRGRLKGPCLVLVIE
jgi:ubiquitin carboxyl-terminal hydrolase 16/45